MQEYHHVAEMEKLDARDRIQDRDENGKDNQ